MYYGRIRIWGIVNGEGGLEVNVSAGWGEYRGWVERSSVVKLHNVCT